MAGEFMVINPRRRRRSKTKNRRRRARAHHNPSRRRRRNPRRRRSYARVNRRRRHRVHSNPRMFYGINLGDAAVTALGGVVGSDIAAGWLTKFLPSNIQSPVARLGVKAAVGIGAPLVLKRFIGAKTAHLIAAGTAIGVILDAYHLWVAPALGLSGYEVGLTGYEANPGLSGSNAPGMEALGIGENIYADSVY